MALVVCVEQDDSTPMCFLVDKMLQTNVSAPRGSSGSLALNTDIYAYHQAVGSPHALPLIATIVGVEASLRLDSKLKYLAQSVRGSSKAYDRSQFVFVGDQLACEDNGWNDKNTLDALRKGVPLSVSLPIKSLSSREQLGSISPLVDAHGLDRLQAFYDTILKGLPLVKTWADVIMVVIIMYTSVYWEERLARLYPRLHLHSIIEALAKFAMDSYPVADHNDKAFDPDPLLIHTSLKILRHLGHISAV